MKNTLLKSPFVAITRSHLRHALIAFAATAAMLLAPATSAWAEINLVFGTYAADKPTETVKKYKSFLTYLAQEMSKELGEPVTIRMKIAKEYEAGIGQLADGLVDFARFGPASYVTVHQLNNNVQIVAMETNKGKKRFKGVIAVHADSDFQTLSDLQEQSFAFGDQLSTIGRYLAQSHLINAGVTSENLSRFEYLGRHDRVGSAVGSEQFTAGALKESTFKKQVESGVPIRMLFEFDNVTKPWLSSSDMTPRVFQAMQSVMLQTSDPEILNNVAKGGFVEGFDSDYDFVRVAMKHSLEF